MLDNENTVLGGLVADAKRILSTLAGVLLLGTFIGLLIAPALEPLFCRKLYSKCNNGSVEEMSSAMRKLKGIRVVLWILCACAWAFLIWANKN